MIGACRLVDGFADGQLTPAQHHAFQLHLAGCLRCSRALASIFCLKGLAETVDVGAPLPVTEHFLPVVRRRSRWLMSWAVGVALAAAAVLVLVWELPRRRAPVSVWAMAEHRPLEPRLTRPEADQYRPLAVQRGGGWSGGRRDFDLMNRLQERGDVTGLVTRLLLERDVSAARAVIADHPEAPLAQERAVLALLEGKPEEALGALAPLLQGNGVARPSQALWNRALALRDLGLGYSAASTFREVAGRQEPGWQAEAGTWARALESQTDERKRRWQEARRAAERLGRSRELPAPQVVQQFPDIVREAFYDAVRGAPDARALDGLAALAADLDRRQGGGQVLTGYLRRVRGFDFRVRGPLARSYAQLAQNGWQEKAPVAVGRLQAFSDELRRAGRVGQDLRLGFLLAGAGRASDPDELPRLAAAMDDPWLQAMAAELADRTSVGVGERERERRLRAAIDQATAAGLVAPRLRLQIRRAYQLLREERLREAGPLMMEARAAAQASELWNLEMTALFQLANLASRRQEPAAVRAYGDEVVLGEGSCQSKVVVAELLAERATNDGRPDEARQALAAVEGCDPAATQRLAALSALSELAARHPGGGDLLAFRRLADAMRPRLGPGERLMARALEGRAVLTSDREVGRGLLEGVRAEAERLPANELNVIKPRLLAYRRLVSDAVAHDESAQALKLIAEEARVSLPAGCVVGLGEDMRRVFVVSRAADGRHLSALRPPGNTSPEQLVPEQHRRLLASCPQVAVVALPPFHGRARLLGPELAWFHHTGARQPGETWRLEQRLVVSDVPAPRQLALPALSPWQPPRNSPTPIRHLAGAQANPRAVADALGEADLAEFHVHGLVDLGVADESFLVLSPDENRRDSLTAGEVRKLHLTRRPFVVLAACNSAVSSPYFPSYSGWWSLPPAFLQAGARGVLAATTPISDQAAQAFFAEVVDRLERGSSPAVALRDSRLAWLSRADRPAWIEDIVLFQ